MAESRAWAGLLVLDELGWLEREALAFQRAVRACLGGTTPVLGVVKPRRAGTWLEDLVRTPGGAVLPVDAENRDGLPALLAERLRGALGQQEE